LPDFVDVCALDELEENRPLGLQVGGASLVLLRRGEEVVAVADRCPHLGFPLSQGHLREGRLVCALHHWRFDVFEEPAPAVPPEARCLHWPVRVVAGRVQVDFARDPEAR
jgi:nitrite reductase/ring-hydroxylating ferredoxin subunit